MIKFNEVTWYSKLVAIIVFVGVLPALTFYMGVQYQQVRESAESTIIQNANRNISNNENSARTEKASTYSNKKYGFVLNFPSGWSAYDVDSVENEGGIDTFITDDLKKPTYLTQPNGILKRNSYVRIAYDIEPISDGPKGTIMHKDLDSLEETYKGPAAERKNIGGIDALIIKGKQGPGHIDIFIMQGDGKFIDFQGIENDISEQILMSLKKI